MGPSIPLLQPFYARTTAACGALTPSTAQLPSLPYPALPCRPAGNAACTLDNGTTAACTVAGIAKFPYLSMEV